MSESFLQVTSQPQDESNPYNPETPDKVIDRSEKNGMKTKTIIYRDNRGRGLQAQLYQLVEGKYEQLTLVKSKSEPDVVPGDDSFLTAYNAVAKLENSHPVHRNQRKSPMAATFVAAIRLFEGNESDLPIWPKVPTSKTLYDHVGIDPLREHATAAM